MSARMPRFPDSPEGVALALAYLIVQAKGKNPDDPPPDMIALYRKCFEVVTGPDYDTLRTGLLH
jgi:hypothetical protein